MENVSRRVTRWLGGVLRLLITPADLAVELYWPSRACVQRVSAKPHIRARERRGLCACWTGQCLRSTCKGRDPRLLSATRPRLQHGCRCRASANLNKRMSARYADTNSNRRSRQCVGSPCLVTHSDAALPRACLLQQVNDAPDHAVLASPPMTRRSYGSPEEMNSISDAVLFARHADCKAAGRGLVPRGSIGGFFACVNILLELFVE